MAVTVVFPSDSLTTNGYTVLFCCFLKLILLREFYPGFLEKRKENILGRRQMMETNGEVLI